MQVDGSQWGRKLAQVGRRCADEARKLAEAPMGRRNGLVRARETQGETFVILAPGFDADIDATHSAGLTPVRSAAD